MIAFRAVILVKFDLEAESAAVHIPDRAQRGIALAADTDVFDRFPVNDDRAWRIFFALTGFKETVPVVDHNIKCVNSGTVEQPVFIADCMCRCSDSERLTVAEQNRENKRQCGNHGADLVDAFMC